MTGGEAERSVCVIGAGAVGGLVGGRMARAGADVTLVDRGARLETLRSRGLTLVSPDGGRERIEGITVAADTTAVGPQDVVVLGVKTYDLPAAVRQVPAATGPRTVVVPLQNGIPWWYFHRFGGRFDGRRLRTLDPDGAIAAGVDADRVLGCVPYVAAEVVEGGAVRHREGGYFPVGELDGSDSERVRRTAGLFERAGFRSRVLEDVRSEIWLKAWGSLSLNPISALTGATLREICRDEGTRGLARAMMEEAREVAETLGASFRRSIERRIEGAREVGDHRTSMLQDLEDGRPLEVEGLVGAVVELAELTDTPVPRIRAVYALAKLLASSRGGSDGVVYGRPRPEGEITPPDELAVGG